MEILIIILIYKFYTLLYYKYLNNYNYLIINIIMMLLFTIKIYLYLCGINNNYNIIINNILIYNNIIFNSIEYNNNIIYCNNEILIYINNIILIVNTNINIINYYDINLNNLFLIKLTIHKMSYHIIELYALHSFIITTYNEITLLFFRIYNNNLYKYTVIILYYIYPIDLLSWIIKLQCFCFETLIITAHETIELPVLLYIQYNNINNNTILLQYLLLFK